DPLAEQRLEVRREVPTTPLGLEARTGKAVELALQRLAIAGIFLKRFAGRLESLFQNRDLLDYTFQIRTGAAQCFLTDILDLSVQFLNLVALGVDVAFVLLDAFPL